MDPELGGDGAHPPVLDEVVAQDLRLEFVVDRHRALRSAPGPSASSHRRAPPLSADELADRARTEVAVHRGSAARCANSDGWFGRHRWIRLVHRNLMRGEFSTARGASGTVMRHFLCTRVFAAPAPVAALALGVTVPAASRVLIPASRRAQRFTPSGAAATCPAVLLAPVATRADEHLAPASGTQKQSGIVHCSPRRGGLDDPRLPGNTALGAVRQCGSGRSLGRDRQVNVVRGCAGLPDHCDLTPTAERRHRTGAPRRHLLVGNIGSGGRQRQTPGRGTGTTQSSSAPISQIQFTRAVRRIAALLRSRLQTAPSAATPTRCRPATATFGRSPARLRSDAEWPSRSFAGLRSLATNGDAVVDGGAEELLESVGGFEVERGDLGVAPDAASPPPWMRNWGAPSTDGRAGVERFSSVEDGVISWDLSKTRSPS